MTTPAATQTRPGASGPRRVAVHPVTFRRLVAAEWVKARSLRSTWWILALGVVAFPALAALRASSVAAIAEDAYGHLVGPVYVTSGVALGQLAFCALAVVLVTGEHRTGQVRSTFAAAPGRVGALWAKATVTVALVLAAGVVAVAAGWAAAAPWFAPTGMTVDLSRADHARLVLGVPLYLAALVALAHGIGAVVRSSAAGITVVLGLVFVVENALGLVPWAPVRDLAAFLPTTAGARLITDDGTGSVVTAGGGVVLSPWAGFGVLVAWVVAVGVVASVLVRRRDV